MAEKDGRQLRAVGAPFVVLGPSGVAVRDRLKHLTGEDEEVLRLIGEHLGRLASLDLKVRCADGLEHGPDLWAARKQGLTADSSSRWAGAITRTTHDQWALSRRCHLAHLHTLEAGIEMLRHRLSLPLGEKGDKRMPGGYRSKREWFHKSRRLRTLEHRETPSAAYRLDVHGSPVGDSRRFSYDLSGSAGHRDAQIRHALTRLLHWTKQIGAQAIGVENLDFAAEKTREKHGRKKRFRQLISGMPTGQLKARIVSMAAEHGLAIVAVDPAYTSMWGDAHWRKPLTSNTRKMTRHDAAAVAIGKRALGHPIRRRTTPPPDDRSDCQGHRTVQADRGIRGREGTRHPATERAHDPRRRAGPMRTRGTSASNTVRDAPSSGTWVQDPLLHTG